MRVPFNIPYISGNEKKYVMDVIDHSKTDDYITYNAKCRSLFKKTWGFNEIYLTSSCTSALEVCAMLLDIRPGDEVIIPSYTFPSTANAFIRQGAKVVLADSRTDNPGIDEDQIESLITGKTRAIVPVHYAGVACDMDKIMKIADDHKLFVIEDNAHGIDAYYNKHALSTIGHLGCLSFHNTKNIQCGEGGAVVINDKRFNDRAVNIIEKGTNKRDFVSGKSKMYEWVDIGSSFSLSEIHSAYLYAQLEKVKWIKQHRTSIWDEYFKSLLPLHEKGLIQLPGISEYAFKNAHIFYIVLKSRKIMEALKTYLTNHGVQATAHYTTLHKSRYWRMNNFTIKRDVNCSHFNDSLLRLPLFNSMSLKDVRFVISTLNQYFKL